LAVLKFQRPFVKVIDFTVVIDGVAHSAAGLSATDFYHKMAMAKELPTTSQGSVMAVVHLLEDFVNEGVTDVIVMTISSSLSGSYQTIQMATKEVTGLRVHLPDTKTAEVMLGSAVMAVARMIEAGESVATILPQLQTRLAADGALFYVDSLKHLVKGGRISGASGMVGDVLKIKPLLELNGQGTIELSEKKRTKTKALERLMALYQEATNDRPHVVYFLYSDNPEEVTAFAKHVTSLATERHVVPLTPVVGAHTGPGVIGIGWGYAEGA
jgi:DegV family protein with EDD domain